MGQIECEYRGEVNAGNLAAVGHARDAELRTELVEVADDSARDLRRAIADAGSGYRAVVSFEGPLGSLEPTARTWNVYVVSLVRPVTVNPAWLTPPGPLLGIGVHPSR